jgi:hypothetical protein
LIGFHEILRAVLWLLNPCSPVWGSDDELQTLLGFRTGF